MTPTRKHGADDSHSDGLDSIVRMNDFLEFMVAFGVIRINIYRVRGDAKTRSKQDGQCGNLHKKPGVVRSSV
jgi:hypothetical protein